MLSKGASGNVSEHFTSRSTWCMCKTEQQTCTVVSPIPEAKLWCQTLSGFCVLLVDVFMCIGGVRCRKWLSRLRMQTHAALCSTLEHCPVFCPLVSSWLTCPSWHTRGLWCLLVSLISAVSHLTMDSVWWWRWCLGLLGKFYAKMLPSSFVVVVITIII